jgi:hypothetical protein
MASNRNTLTSFLRDVAVYHDLRDRNNIYKALINTGGSDENAAANKEKADAAENDRIDETFDNIIQGTDGIMPWAAYTPEESQNGNPAEEQQGYAQILNESLAGGAPPDYLKNAFKYVGNWNNRITSGLDNLTNNNYLYDKNVSLASIIYGNKFPEVLERNKIDCEGNISPEFPIVNIGEMKAWWLGRGVSDTNLVKFFAQGIPSVELSQAVPYFDLKIIDRTLDSVITEGSVSRVGKGMSAVKFIKGFGEISDTDKHILESELSPEGRGAQGLSSGSFTPSIAGMELFTLPQTYQGAHKKYIDLNPDGLGGDSSRKNSIIDPFRPLMTIKQFKYTIDTSYVTMPTIRGTLDIVLHDRSRMHEISPLIRPDQNSKQEFLIEFGWSHPRKDTVYGKFLNASRQKRKFIVMSSNYSFDTSGQVSITVNLISKGGGAFANELPSAAPGSGAVEIFRELSETISALQEKLSSNRETTAALSKSFALGKFTSAGDIITVKPDDLKKIRDQVKKYQRNAVKANEVVQETLKSIDTACANVESYRTKVNDAYEKMVALIDLSAESQTKSIDSSRKAHDPWAECWDSVKAKPGMQDRFSTKTHISVGRLLSIICLPVLMKQEKWDQIDFMYYPCNKDSYGLQYFPTIASLPVKKTEFKQQLKMFRQTRAPNPPLLTLVHLVLKFVKEYKGNDSGWGLGGALTSIVNQKTGKIEAKYAGKKKATYLERMTKQASEIYGGPRRLKNPSFKVDVETVPFEKDDTKSVLRISIMDGANDQYRTYSDLIRSISSEASGILSKAIPEPTDDQAAADLIQVQKAFDQLTSIGYLKPIDSSKITTATGDNQITLAGNDKYAVLTGASRIKHFLSTILPTFKFGTEFSIIKSVSVSSNSDSALGLINLKRNMESADRPAGTEADDSVPFEVLPTTLGLSTIGCPFFRHMQQYFFDYQTNTSIDNVYIVTGVEHNIAPGRFESTLKLSKVEFYGTFENISSKLTDLQYALAATEEE